jgi:hypothetical protein
MESHNKHIHTRGHYEDLHTRHINISKRASRDNSSNYSHSRRDHRLRSYKRNEEVEYLMTTPLYNISNLTKNSTTMYDIFRVANNWSEGVLGIGIIILTFLAAYVLTYLEAPETRLYIASIVTMVIATGLRVLQLVNNMPLYFCLALLGISAWLFYTKTEDS